MPEKMTAMERLEQQLNEKDAEIERLESEAQKSRDSKAWDWLSLPRLLDADPSPSLPLPRLEIRYEALDDDSYNWQADYCLYLPHYLPGKVQVVPIGSTRISGGGGPRREVAGMHAGKFYGPFRDGAHIRHDMATLGLPAFIVVGDEADPVVPNKEKPHE